MLVPGIAAPDASKTLPEICPVPCAKSAVAASSPMRILKLRWSNVLTSLIGDSGLRLSALTTKGDSRQWLTILPDLLQYGPEGFAPEVTKQTCHRDSVPLRSLVNRIARVHSLMNEIENIF